MKRSNRWPSRGFLLMELAVALAVIGGLIALLIPLLNLQGQIDTQQRDSQSLKQAREALLGQAASGFGLPAPLRLAEGTSGSDTVTSHVELKSPQATLGLGWAGALPGALLGVPSISPLQTAYWYDAQPALRSDLGAAFVPAVQQPQVGTWVFRPIVEQFDPDINPNLSTGGVRAQLCRNLNSLQAIEQGIRDYPSNTAADYKRDNINVTLPRIWATGYESRFSWDASQGFATTSEDNLTAVFENSSAAAFVVVRRQPPALRRLDRQNAVYGQVGSTGLDKALADRGSQAYPASITSGTRGFRVYENPQTAPFDDPTSDTRDYDGKVQAVSLNELASSLRQAGVCTAAAETCKANQLYVRVGNYVRSSPASGSAEGLTLHWELMDQDPTTGNLTVVSAGDVGSDSTSAGQCMDAFSTDVATQARSRYLRISFKTPTGAIGYEDGNAAGYWHRSALLVDPNGNRPAADNGVNRWRNLSALSAAEAGKTVTVNCAGSQSLLANGQLARTGGSLPTCTVTQLP